MKTAIICGLAIYISAIIYSVIYVSENIVLNGTKEDALLILVMSPVIALALSFLLGLFVVSTLATINVIRDVLRLVINRLKK